MTRLLHRLRRMIAGLMACKWHECDDEYGVIEW